MKNSQQNNQCSILGHKMDYPTLQKIGYEHVN
jgi:hypothetical protein